MTAPTVLELYAGGGGSALGLRAAGFESVALVERDADACATLRAAGFGPVVEGDVRDFAAFAGAARPNYPGPPDPAPTVLWSSFPCQIWSSMGNKTGAADTDRDGWPATLKAVDLWRPEWVVCENVVRLTEAAPSCRGACPHSCPRCYLEHVILNRLRRRYPSVQWVVLNAADFGVAQRRRRLFIVAGPSPIRWPAPTHRAPDQPSLFGRLRPYISAGQALRLQFGNRGYLHGQRNTEANPTQQRPAPMTEPAPTVGTRGSLIYHYAGKDRALSPEECARLQGLPDDHPWVGNITSRHFQVGNAVPPILAELIGWSILAETARR